MRLFKHAFITSALVLTSAAALAAPASADTATGAPTAPRRSPSCHSIL